MTLAVAPALNHSGVEHLDTVQLADIMASELTYAQGITVIPVNRVLAVLAAQGVESVQDPEHALETAKLVGADGILVFAITDYDPYDPPRIGITAQLYGKQPGHGGAAMDPVEMSRQTTSAAGAADLGRPGLLAQSQRVFDASHEWVAQDVKNFAHQRGTGGSAFGWRKYLVSQKDYFRYCSFVTIRTLFAGHEAAAESDGVNPGTSTDE